MPADRRFAGEWSITREPGILRQGRIALAQIPVPSDVVDWAKSSDGRILALVELDYSFPTFESCPRFYDERDALEVLRSLMSITQTTTSD